jgi:hypothetical protein
MTAEGNLRKMSTEPGETVQYTMRLFDRLEPSESFSVNELVGKEMSISFTGQIHCVVTGKPIKKAYGEGMGYDAFMKSPLAVESIIRPELSRIHEGIALRDKEWEEEHHNRPHYVYLSLTNDIKVGVTRTSNTPYRWHDQGATEAVVIAETPYRQLAGLIEVMLKDHLPDKTHWQKMLKDIRENTVSITDKKAMVSKLLAPEYGAYLQPDAEVERIAYPVLAYPEKLISLKLDKQGEFEGKLMGIKGQYLLFEGGYVLNVRSHAGYRVKIES